MTIHNIGLSGCRLQLVNNTTLRKTSSSELYNDRLKRQMEKQIMFQTKGYDGLVVPAVLGHGMQSNKFYFDMTYINGKLFEEEFNVVSKEKLKIYLHNLVEYVHDIKQKSTDQYNSNELKDIIKTKMLMLHKSSKHSHLIDCVMHWLDQVTIQPIEKGLCHGDLTFSNMLFVNNKICFLDFLDSYIESYVMDLVKLKQDLYYNWYIRIHDTPNTMRIKQIFKFLWNKIEQEFPVTKTELFYLLDLINFLRIEPYVKSEKQQQVLESILGETWLYEKFNSSHDGEVYTISKP